MFAIGRGRRLAMLVALSAGGLLATATTVGITPFLLDIARDLHTDLAAAGNLVALQSVTWGMVSLFAGVASDRLGRRPLLVAGLLILVISSVGVAVADSFVWVAAWRLVGGLGGGTFMGAVFATVSDHFPAAERGRSLGWVVTGQSLALVLGVPAMTLAGQPGWLARRRAGARRGRVRVRRGGLVAGPEPIGPIRRAAAATSLRSPGSSDRAGWPCSWPARPSACATPPSPSFCRPIC